MIEEMAIGPESFSALLERQAPASDFSQWFWQHSEPNKPSPANWMDLVVPVARAVQDLEWMTTAERNSIRWLILDFMRYAFTKLWTPYAIPDSQLKEALDVFTSWLAARSDAVVVRFCWDLLSHDRSDTPNPVWWLKHSGRLSGEISYDNLRLAVSIADEGDAMYWWPDARWAVIRWDRDSLPYTELLSHASYLVRAAAAKTLGRMFFGAIENSSHSAPQPVEVLETIQECEVRSPGIAGPFLDGAQWSIAPDVWANELDMRTWFMETLRRSGREPDTPHMQSLEFYAHELFAVDATAIREFLDIGRRDLALMTATEAPEAIAVIPELLALLHEMASSSDASVSTAIRTYLSLRSHHAGLEYSE